MHDPKANMLTQIFKAGRKQQNREHARQRAVSRLTQRYLENPNHRKGTKYFKLWARFQTSPRSLSKFTILRG